MINNRQNGRRRGRGPQPGNNRPNRPEQGNRIDNRARGNANQLHDKYKALARDAQMQGDRVLTEYYLQFADHYFRVLSESRQRFEEQRRPQNEAGDYDRDGSQDDGDDFVDEFRTADAVYRGLDTAAPRSAQVEESGESDVREVRREERQPRQRDGQRGDGQREGQRDERGGNREPRQDREPRADRQPRADRVARDERPERPVRELRLELEPRRETSVAAVVPAVRAEVSEPAVAEAGDSPIVEERAPRRRGRPRREDRVVAEAAAEAAPAERFEGDRLPPSVSAASVPAADAPAEDAAEAPKKRRTRRVRPDDETPVAA